MTYLMQARVSTPTMNPGHGGLWILAVSAQFLKSHCFMRKTPTVAVPTDYLFELK